ncbi:MAG: hypothetical protein Q4F05_06615, partial [bacterium]|nr:hypothetical protein [bacterium]
MKKKVIAMMAVICISLLSITACSSDGKNNNSATDDRANKNTTSPTDILDDVEKGVDDAGKDIEKAGDDVKDDAEKAGDDVKDGVEDILGSDNANNNNDKYDDMLCDLL